MQLDFSPEWDALLEGIEQEQATAAALNTPPLANESTSSMKDSRDGADDEKGEVGVASLRLLMRLVYDDDDDDDDEYTNLSFTSASCCFLFIYSTPSIFTTTRHLSP